VGQVVHTLPEGQPVRGVTSLDNEIFLLRDKERDQVEVYDVITYRLQRCLTVPNARGFVDMTSCEHYHCLYIGNGIDECVHRLDVDGATTTRWAIHDNPYSLSVNSSHNVVVTLTEACKIKEFSSHGDLLRELTLPDDVISPWHTIQSRSGQFVVGHSKFCAEVHRVCVISADDRRIVHSHGGQWRPGSGQYYMPCHLAVDDSERIFVADNGNRRVMLLSPALDDVRQVVSSDQLKWACDRLSFDAHRRRLYVADNEFTDKPIGGRVVVFSV